MYISRFLSSNFLKPLSQLNCLQLLLLSFLPSQGKSSARDHWRMSLIRLSISIAVGWTGGWVSREVSIIDFSKRCKRLIVCAVSMARCPDAPQMGRGRRKGSKGNAATESPVSHLLPRQLKLGASHFHCCLFYCWARQVVCTQNNSTAHTGQVPGPTSGWGGGSLSSCCWDSAWLQPVMAAFTQF